MKIAINGCGIAGPTLAWWLRRYGHEPVLFEKAKALRTGGHIIDFWGSGYDVAEKMGLFPQILDDSYIMEGLRTVTAGGYTTSSLNVQVFQELTDNRYLSIARSDLSKRIFDACEGIETRFGTSIVGVEDASDYVRVKRSDQEFENFDLVIGADGLHSKIRALTFGPQASFEHPTGFYVAAFTMSGYRPRDELIYLSHTVPGRQISRVALRDDKTLFLFIFSDHFVDQEPASEDAEKAMLRKVFGDMKWETSAILDRMEEVKEIYFDRVSQIRMPNWAKGRVALVGDAAACPSLLAGEGTGFAMTQAYVLAGELHRAGENHLSAFPAYEARLHTYVTKKQDAALKFTGFFAPKNWLSLIARDVLTNIASIPVLAKILLGSSFKNDIDLPIYGDSPSTHMPVFHPRD